MASIYWLTRLSSIQGMFAAASVITGLIIGIGIIGYSISIFDCYSDEREKELKTKRKYFINRVWIPVLLLVFTILIPNTKEAMLIIAGGKTMDYVQKDTSLQKIPYKATELILKKMDQYIDETSKLEHKDTAK
jgi:hypothetical protein